MSVDAPNLPTKGEVVERYAYLNILGPFIQMAWTGALRRRAGSEGTGDLVLDPGGDDPDRRVNDPSVAVADLAGNNAVDAAGTDRTVAYDSIAPSFTLVQAGDQLDPTNVASIGFTFTASEPVALWTLTSGDFAVTNGTLASLDCTTDLVTTCAITVTASGQGAVSVAPSAGFSVADPAGNVTTTIEYGIDRSVTYDTVAPTLTLAQAAGQADPAKDAPIRFTLSSNEALDTSSVTADDFAVVNGTASVVCADASVSSAVAHFTEQRTDLLKLLTPLAPEDWLREGTVTGAGKPIVRSVLTYGDWLARHERAHLRSIGKTVQAVQELARR